MFYLLFGISGGEVMVVLLLVLLLFGTDKLPEALRMLGKAIGRVNAARDELTRQVHHSMDDPRHAFEDVEVELPDEEAPGAVPEDEDAPARVKRAD
ncbi:sec-independent protein translocase protein TatB [Breznakibacter xylanolyticus]|uniref:Sec-independent protein translocase protein TatB n=1 Tax=Breznakibacter xylanolyticus TaxID=990 RepID=A0A2W7NVL8_9BACT|nr:twin-arginine translocase TatA/TatE family subunit [Breznakibacter xylanolyticus]PZX20664.1 sec-independent protein translocase protein TatB [Breznakibacter xylanolyticus]